MRSTNVNNGNRNGDGGKLTIKTSAILAAIWAGLFGYEAFAGYMMAEQLFLLVALGLGRRDHTDDCYPSVWDQDRRAGA